MNIKRTLPAIVAIVLGIVGFTSMATAPLVVPDALGLRLTEAGLSFIERQLADRELSVGPQLISQPDVLCYDMIGINDAVIEMSLKEVQLDFQGGANESLELVLVVPRIELMGELFADDSDFFDLCPSFSTNIQEFLVTGVVFTANISPSVDENYFLQIDFVAPPQIYFDNLSIDLENFSDTLEDLVFSAEFIQDFIMARINSVLAEMVPEMMRETALQAVFEGEAGGFEFVIGVGEIAIDDNGGNINLDVGLASSLPTASCIDQVPGVAFNPVGPMGLGQHNDLSMLEFSITDAILNQALYVAWRVGFMCFSDEHSQLAVFESLLPGLESLSGEQLQYTVAVQQPPRVDFKTNGQIVLTVKDFQMEAYSAFSGESPKLLFGVEADFTAAAILTMDKQTNQILLSLDALSADFSRLESEVLYSDNPSAEEDLINLITGYVLPRMQNEFTDIPVTNSIIYAADYVLLVDFLDIVQGHAVAGLSLFETDDPSIDRVAPDTFFTYSPAATTYSTESIIQYDGTDSGGGGGELVFSYKLDDAAWSPWKKEKFAELPALTDGTHTVQVKARDRFLNEDSTPAVANFAVEAAPRGQDIGAPACTCNLTTRPVPQSKGAAGALIAALLTALALRRRRRGQQ